MLKSEKTLDEALLLVDDPHVDMRDVVVPIWLDLSTGRVITEPPTNPEGYCRLWRASEAKPTKKRSAKAKEDDEDVPFPICPVCTKSGKRKISDLVTKGEQPFANIVRAQFALQAPTRRRSSEYPNGGRKVLLFSDGRQKAARLARDLPREVEFDTFREALVLAVQALQRIGKTPKLNSSLYVAFVAVCAEAHLAFFDQQDRSQENFLNDLESYREYYDLAGALADWRPTLPPRYQQVLLDQLTNPFYSLYSICAAVVKPTDQALKALQKELTGFPETFLQQDLSAVTTVWIQHLLQETAYDDTILDVSRRTVSQFRERRSYGSSIRSFDKLLNYALNATQIQQLTKQLYAVLTADKDGSAYLYPRKLAVELAVEFGLVSVSCLRASFT